MRRIALAAAIILAAVTNLWAQGAGQLPAWNVLGNPSAAASNARSATLNAMLNGAFGCSNGQILLRGASVWACQTLGALGTLNVGTGLSSGGGNLNIANTIAAGGPTGSATIVPILTYNAQGQLTVVSSATIAPPFSAITGTLPNSQLAQMPAATVKCNPTSTTAAAQDCPGIGPGFATLQPFPGQLSGATNGLNATDPFGVAISTAGTQCQGVEKFLTAVSASHWSWRIIGNYNISCNTPLAFPTCASLSEYIDAGITFTFTAQGATTLITSDSHENCYSRFIGQAVQNAADTGIVFALKPATNDTLGNTTIAASYMELFTAVSPAPGGTGIVLDLTAGGILGSKIWMNDVNGGATCIKVINPGTAFIAYEHNEEHYGYIHGCTTRVLQIGTSTTNASTMRENNRHFGRFEPGTGASAGLDSWANDDRYYGINVTNETANATNGIVLESGACNNKFFGGTVKATTALSDSCASNNNVFQGVTNVPNNYARQIVSLSAGGTTQAQSTTQFQVTIGSAGEGFVYGTCPFTGTFRNLRLNTTAPAAGQTITATWRVNGADTSIACTVTGTGTTCNDTTHTAACTAGQTYSLKTVTSATTGTISSISGGIEYDYP